MSNTNMIQARLKLLFLQCQTPIWYRQDQNSCSFSVKHQYDTGKTKTPVPSVSNTNMIQARLKLLFLQCQTPIWYRQDQNSCSFSVKHQYDTGKTKNSCSFSVKHQYDTGKTKTPVPSVSNTNMIQARLKLLFLQCQTPIWYRQD